MGIVVNVVILADLVAHQRNLHCALGELLRFSRSARSTSINTPGKSAGEFLAAPISDHPPFTRASAVARPIPFDAPVMTMDLTMGAAQLLSRYLLAANLLSYCAKKHTRYYAPDQWAEHRPDHMAPVRGPLAF